ncbi:hypothetical protein P280DRAFT_455925 [Massarina eburnea CBS 473.64]|uniref:Uncharacterized protein n=1 Tax=Massarina eburnea CBS 473.64 TaxID=1395130 RepID=A0A6A6RUP7_9PLEO|nr:hypothetical protein P280DRAFT_455925 [Massarina eburnea CBS 473.64]
MSKMTRPPPRPIQRLLIANRGEIATRIISSARELSLQTYAIYVSGDSSHALHANHAIQIPSASIFMDISALITLVQKHEIDAVHPGYGFLSESADFAKRMWEEANVIVVGPGWEILEKTGDKLMARELAKRCNVPVSPALTTPTSSASEILAFANTVGYPIIVKAVDGGGGRGIRLIRKESDLESAVARAVEESPSKKLFAEKAAVDGFRHIEVQIIGDGRGNVTHLWERECSIQRRYQKIVEIAPSVVSDRALIGRVIADAVRMAEEITYFSLGTFEFLLSPTTQTHYFLEINPRLQVEHTITETLTTTDLIQTQLLLTQGAPLSSCHLPPPLPPTSPPPPTHSIQLRLTSENPSTAFSLSIGKISSFAFPHGNGVRIDTHLVPGHATIISTSFDSLLAKIIVTALTWESVVRKAARALQDTRIVGVETNLDVLRGIVGHADFAGGECDTQWLERMQVELLAVGRGVGKARTGMGVGVGEGLEMGVGGGGMGNILFRKGDAWRFTLSPPTLLTPNPSNHPQHHHLQILRIHRNDFPTSLTASIILTSPSQSTPYTLTLATTTSSANSSTSTHRLANPTNPTHIRLPFPGKLISLHIDENDVVKEGDVVAVVQQMKMELEVRSHRSGRVVWVTEAEDGEDVGEGMLVAVVEGGMDARL